MTEKTIYDYLYDYAVTAGNKPLLFNESVGYSVAETLSLTQFAAEVFRRRGIGAGQRVTLCCHRRIETVIVFFALQALGAQTVLCDPHEDGIRDVLPVKNGFVFRGEYTVFPVPMPALNDNFVAFSDSKVPTVVIRTSGSTGASKNVLLSQYNILNNSLDTLPLGWYLPEDIAMAVLPLFHVFGLSLFVTALPAKYAVFFPERTENDYILGCIEKYGITRMNGVPSLYYALAKENEREKRDISSLRTGLVGGAPVTEEQFAYIEQSMKVTLLPVYGMSECIGISCASYLDPQEVRAVSVGKVYPMNRVKVAADGEILVRSPALMCGYEGETVFTDEDGFFHTGDTGCLDEGGYLHITGRLKDIIIRNGNNLSLVEIEGKIGMLPFVEECAAIGIKDEAVGEVPCVVIVLKYGHGYDHSLLSSVLKKIEMPKDVKVIERLPLTASGKTDKQKIKEMFF